MAGSYHCLIRGRMLLGLVCPLLVCHCFGASQGAARQGSALAGTLAQRVCVLTVAAAAVVALQRDPPANLTPLLPLTVQQGEQQQNRQAPPMLVFARTMLLQYWTYTGNSASLSHATQHTSWCLVLEYTDPAQHACFTSNTLTKYFSVLNCLLMYRYWWYNAGLVSGVCRPQPCSAAAGVHHAATNARASQGEVVGCCCGVLRCAVPLSAPLRHCCYRGLCFNLVFICGLLDAPLVYVYTLTLLCCICCS